MDINYLVFNEFLSNNTSMLTICRKFKISPLEFKNILISHKYFRINDSSFLNSVKKYYEAANYYLHNNVTYSFTSKLFKIDTTLFKDYMNTYYPETKELDDTVFDFIDTEEKAYWLGFLYADGCVGKYIKGKSGYSIELSLKGSDILHLQKFKHFLKCTKTIQTSTVSCNGKSFTRCRLCIYSYRIWNLLNKLGCIPNKSLILKFPDASIFSNKDLIRHFIRGYWDGDGCLVYSKSYNRIWISVIGTQYTLLGIQDYLLTNIKLYNNHGSEIIKNLKYNGLKAFIIAYKLYNDSTIYLLRKFDKYLEFCRLYLKLYKLLQTNIGEDCDVNTEITEETKESSAS